MLKSNWIGNLTGIYNQKRIGKVYQQKVGHEDYLMWLAVLQKARNGLAYCIPETAGLLPIVYPFAVGNKIRAADWQWRIYRQHLGLSYQKSCYLFATYLFNAVVKRNDHEGDVSGGGSGLLRLVGALRLWHRAANPIC